MSDRSEILKRIKETLQRVAPEAQSIVYGSQARGDFRPDSDIDLLIIIDKERLSVKEEQQITMPLYEIEIETGVPHQSDDCFKKELGKKAIQNAFPNRYPK
jgi:predicted nucleotidyltransferase